MAPDSPPWIVVGAWRLAPVEQTMVVSTLHRSDLQPVLGPAAWRGDEIGQRTDWMYGLGAAEVSELEQAGAALLHNDPDLRYVQAKDYPLPATTAGLKSWAAQMDRGCGFALVRGLRSDLYSDALSAAIFYVLGLHLGEPMRQNELGDSLDHVMATSDKMLSDPKALGSRTRDRLNFHSDSSDVVALMCLRGAKSGGASILISGASVYNEVLRQRPDLAPLLFEPWHFDWLRQDHDAPASYYSSPMCSYVDGVFSMYAGSRIIRSAQEYPETPRLSAAQLELLDLLDEIYLEPGLPLTMDFRPGDIQWLLNYAALHSRTSYEDHAERRRRRHLLRLWLRRDVARPLVKGFGRNVVKGRSEVREQEVLQDVARFRISELCYPRVDWES